ncbi:MAG TPA: cytochrome c biogenesis protein CcsA [Candidatus Thermoplasmatota archaeon]|nr:cytochrome c biogenesis protein CcsA [Candidatus Thermoplasmatota archaeon]
MRWLIWTAVAAMIVQLPLALVVAPQAANFNAPLTQRILYYHVPAAWVAYLAFAVTAVACAWVLWRDDARADRLAVASAEVGTVFGAIALVTGLVWAGQEFFGYSAIEDPKVITLGVLLAAYLAYFALRANLEDEKRARLSAVFGLLCVLGVPLSYLASRASIHPDFTRPEESLDWRLGVILLYSTFALTLLYAALVAMRVRLLRLEERR